MHHNIKEFNRSELKNINFGKLEGEKDHIQLKSSFFPTKAIIECLQGEFNYILSPKGGGKSALFTSIANQYVPKVLFDKDEYSIIPINKAFIYNSDTKLDNSKFKDLERSNDYAISWAIYLLNNILKDIRNNYKDSPGYSTFIKKISEYPEIKADLELYGIKDFLKEVNLKLNFTIEGQPIEVSPGISLPTKTRLFNLNEVFGLANKFYEENNKVALVLIDRIDNFVSRESYKVQKQYVQGLVDCIEELTNLSNISPVLFLRTDLFYSLELTFEYDKVQERLKHLVWEEGEILTFIAIRLLNNKYIKNNYRKYFTDIIINRTDDKHKSYKKLRIPWYKKLLAKLSNNEIKTKEIDLRRTSSYNTSEKFLKTFFPSNINSFELDFCEFIFKKLVDGNDFVNPRLMIIFFNKLFSKQASVDYQIHMNSHEKCAVKKKGDHSNFNIFDQEIFPEVYAETQNESLRFIYMMMTDKESKQMFLHLNDYSHSKKRFEYSYNSTKKIGQTKEDFERFMKYIKLLGYMKDYKTKSKYELPDLYMRKLNLNSHRA